MALYAGICEADITPPPGVWLSGYALRPHGAIGVHDPLYVRALVLENGARRVALLACDLISVDLDMLELVREGICAQQPISPDAVMVHCTHTHAGPFTKSFRCMGRRDEAYVDVLTRKLIGAARQAADCMQPAILT
ncbi:MAG TPA: neutral/alkaline non-lysosomal ceramidase N-terminal domain-containing protein, partial [Chthonomonadales bacterium]|nr:neutral/alkaline non-lysosomal ceramidase N-terminal domain-containing protein [Chthonomonadales bacterium]